jgi:hypothetical protein
MTDKDLRTLLEGLHDELQRTETLDEKGRALLRDLDVDIRDLLQRSGDAGAQADETILERFQSAMDHFEITHPNLTMAISEMMKSLSNAGI